MGWIEYLLIVAGSSLEIFVAMECQIIIETLTMTFEYFL